MRPRADATASIRLVVATVGILFGIQLVTALVPFGVGALAPILRDRFDLTRGEVGLATTAVFTSVALLSIPMGRTADRIGVSRSLLLASLLIGAAVTAIGLVGRFEVLLVLLFVAGVGYAAVTPATNKAILVAAPPRARGRAMGVKQMGVTAGGIVAAAVLPASIQRAGWRPTMLATGAAIGLLGSAGAVGYRRLVHGREPAARSEAASGPVATIPRLVRLGLVVGVMIAVQHAVATYLTLFLVDVRDLSVTAAAGALTLLHASGTGARLGWGWVSDHIGGSRWRTVALLGATSVMALTILAAAGATLPAPAFAILVVVLGVSTQGGNAVFQTALAEEDEPRAGRASGIGMSVGFAGAIFAPPAFGAAVDAVGSYGPPFLVVAGVAAAASVAALRLGARSSASAGHRRPDLPADRLTST